MVPSGYPGRRGLAVCYCSGQAREAVRYGRGHESVHVTAPLHLQPGTAGAQPGEDAEQARAGGQVGSGRLDGGTRAAPAQYQEPAPRHGRRLVKQKEDTSESSGKRRQEVRPVSSLPRRWRYVIDARDASRRVKARLRRPVRPDAEPRRDDGQRDDIARVAVHPLAEARPRVYGVSL
jgi:hypothetical protein